MASTFFIWLQDKFLLSFFLDKFKQLLYLFFTVVVLAEIPWLNYWASQLFSLFWSQILAHYRLFGNLGLHPLCIHQIPSNPRNGNSWTLTDSLFYCFLQTSVWWVPCPEIDNSNFLFLENQLFIFIEMCFREELVLIDTITFERPLLLLT